MEYRLSHSTLLTTQSCTVPHSIITATQSSINAANENLKIKSDWMTPQEALQIVLRIKGKLLKENASNYSLFHSAARRKAWDEINACEQCLRWKYFRH